ncbi:MAG: peptidoglycan DD-metalloendopeptidase family protein [Dehalococcoidia bacterium]
MGSFGLTRVNSDGSPRDHHGIDWLAPLGTVVYAAHHSRVVLCGEQGGGRGYGQRLKLLTLPGEGEQILTLYAHLCVQWVTMGEEVREGHALGLIGRSGYNNTKAIPTHIHHEVRIGGQGKDSAVDPVWYYHEEGATA